MYYTYDKIQQIRIRQDKKKKLQCTRNLKRQKRDLIRREQRQDKQINNDHSDVFYKTNCKYTS